MTNQLNNMPPISYEDWAFLNDNPNPDNVVAWIHTYALAYAAQQVAERQPLTDDEIYTAYITATDQTLRPQDERLAFARAIEAKLKEKNT